MLTGQTNLPNVECERAKNIDRYSQIYRLRVLPSKRQNAQTYAIKNFDISVNYVLKKIRTSLKIFYSYV